MTFPALLAARAHEQGRAQPTALYGHRALGGDPLCIVAWQLGAEPYAVGAIAIGRQRTGFKLFVPGYPIDRDLLFSALLGFAKEFCPKFEACAAGPCEEVSHWGEPLAVPLELPQIVVANTETVALLGRLGRRLAYLRTDGPQPADPLLPRLGRHLMWIADYAQTPGQQLVVPAAELLSTHYATAMSAFEAQSLAAMDAWIEPPHGIHGFHAAEEAESRAVGPLPNPADARRVHELMKTFNEQRAGRKDPLLVRKLAAPLSALYKDLVDDTWSLIWKVIDRERAKPEAASVTRRARDDRFAYARHLQWMNSPAEGRRKTRRTPREAAMRLGELERAETLLAAEEAIDDPMRMAPHLLAGKALAGIVKHRDETRRERINGRNCRRPSIRVRTDERCLMPPGAEVWWTRTPRGREWQIHDVVDAGQGSDVTLVLQTNRFENTDVPRVGARVCFSEFNTRDHYELFLPTQVPWTHQPIAQPAATDLDSAEIGGQAA